MRASLLHVHSFHVACNATRSLDKCHRMSASAVCIRGHTLPTANMHTDPVWEHVSSLKYAGQPPCIAPLQRPGTCTLRWMRALDAPGCAAAGHGEEDLNTAERGLSTTSTHSQAPEIPLSHDPSPTKGAAGAGAAPSGAGPRAPTAPFEANVAAVNQASQAGPRSLPLICSASRGRLWQPCCSHGRPCPWLLLVMLLACHACLPCCLQGKLAACDQACCAPKPWNRSFCLRLLPLQCMCCVQRDIHWKLVSQGCLSAG